MNKAFIISAAASNQGKTVLSMALLHHFKNRVRPYKCGPDFIDPQFHQKITATASINLDGYICNETQLTWMFSNYADKEIAVIEGVMGYYDGMDKGASAYDVAKTLRIPTILVLDGSGSYITIAAVLKGLCEFREDNTIKGVILNKLSSKMHYELIKKHIEAELPDITVLGWIKKDLPALSSTHLGLDLKEIESSKLETLADEVLEHIDIEKLLSLTTYTPPQKPPYPFPSFFQEDKKCVLIQDENFSFVYADNIAYLKERYKSLKIIQATKDEAIPDDADIVILPGGYVETDTAYNRIKDAKKFEASLKEHIKKEKKVYAECAGLVYLGKRCDEKEMLGALDITFTLSQKRERLGYYNSVEEETIHKGHAFHYTKILDAPPTNILLYKTTSKTAKAGGWRKDNIYATYLHTFWRLYPCLI